MMMGSNLGVCDMNMMCNACIDIGACLQTHVDDLMFEAAIKYEYQCFSRLR